MLLLVILPGSIHYRLFIMLEHSVALPQVGNRIIDLKQKQYNSIVGEFTDRRRKAEGDGAIATDSTHTYR